MFELKIDENTANDRLDRVLRKYFRNASDAFLYSMLRKKNITVNGKKAEGSYRTVEGDVLRFWFSAETFEKMRGTAVTVPEEPVPERFPEIEVLYEDEDVLILVKPAGVMAQKAEADSFSVNDWVIAHERRKGKLSGSAYEMFHPAVVNRLDVNTAGIMAAGLSKRGLRILSEIFRNRTLAKYYYALVVGSVTEPGLLKSYLVKDEKENKVKLYRDPVPDSKEIRTEYEPVRYEASKDLTLLRVHLLTGRSHQIRAALSSFGHPILGDPKYGDLKANLRFHKNRQCLLSYRMEFPVCDLPGVSGKTFEIPVPEDWPVRPGGAS